MKQNIIFCNACHHESIEGKESGKIVFCRLHPIDQRNSDIVQQFRFIVCVNVFQIPIIYTKSVKFYSCTHREDAGVYTTCLLFDNEINNRAKYENCYKNFYYVGCLHKKFDPMDTTNTHRQFTSLKGTCTRNIVCYLELSAYGHTKHIK